MIELRKDCVLTLQNFAEVVFHHKKVTVSPEAKIRLNETREFIDDLLTKGIKIYGLTTGFADLRNRSINSEQAGQLSTHVIESHDAGIGDPMDPQVTLGAMLARASSLAKGHSGFQTESLETLVQMINAKMIPLIPKTGSLGASGDLAFLARLGRAMMGKDVPVWYEGNIVKAGDALKTAKIKPFLPQAKEGLAMTNGTSFMVSMLSIAYLKEIHELENMLAMQGVFFNAIGAIDAAFNGCIQNVRNQVGQTLMGQILSHHFAFSPFIDFKGMQDDYCIRCLPQILGSKIEMILEQHHKIERELDAVTDNPLFFKNEEISEDVFKERIIEFQGNRWAVLSGGNFHGECITSIADAICLSNAKIALTMERQLTYMLNPFRNKNKLPAYLIAMDKNTGLFSGYMVTQYTANALTQKICQLGVPTSIFNITSANESEDVVSYGASAAERLLEQLKLFRELNVIYLTVAMQAYAITRENHLQNQGNFSSDFLCEKIFQAYLTCADEEYPIMKEENFNHRYAKADQFLSSQTLGSLTHFPLQNAIETLYTSNDRELLAKMKGKAEVKREAGSYL